MSYNSSLYLALELEIVYNILNNSITALQTTHRPNICTECGWKYGIADPWTTQGFETT